MSLTETYELLDCRPGSSLEFPGKLIFSASLVANWVKKSELQTFRVVTTSLEIDLSLPCVVVISDNSVISFSFISALVIPSEIEFE